MEEGEPPDRTVWLAGPAVFALACCTAAKSSAGDMPPSLSASAIVAVRVAAAGCAAAWAGAGSASACGARQTAAATPARAGTAAAGTTRCLIRLRDGFLWQPKGPLPEQVALTRKAPQGACCPRSA